MPKVAIRKDERVTAKIIITDPVSKKIMTMTAALSDWSITTDAQTMQPVLSKYPVMVTGLTHVSLSGTLTKKPIVKSM